MKGEAEGRKENAGEQVQRNWRSESRKLIVFPLLCSQAQSKMSATCSTGWVSARTARRRPPARRQLHRTPALQAESAVLYVGDSDDTSPAAPRRRLVPIGATSRAMFDNDHDDGDDDDDDSVLVSYLH